MNKLYFNTLDKILLSDNVVKNFFHEFSNKEFKEWLNGILPEVEDCLNQKQDNPWHIYDCLNHILHSVEEINKQTKQYEDNIRRVLAWTMFLHDIGKPATHIRRFAKSYGREVDSFFNHNLVSVKVAERVLDKFNFNNIEKDIIKELINKHDIFMFIALKDKGNKFHHVLTERYLNSVIEELDKVYDGKKMMEYLIKVGRSDNLAQNPEMTTDSLHLLDVMEDMLNQIVIQKL